MSFKTLLASIGAAIVNFVDNFESEVKKLWGEFSPELKAATEQASGIIAILNANVGAVPADIWTLIQTKYPGVTQTAAIAALAKANNTVNATNAIASDATFEEAVTTLQTYLSSLSGNTFVVVVKSVVALIADVFAPGSVIQKIELVLEWVYQELVKPSVPVAAAPAEATAQTAATTEETTAEQTAAEEATAKQAENTTTGDTADDIAAKETEEGNGGGTNTADADA